MAPRTRGIICLGATGNFQGSYKIMCHQTGRKLTRKQFQELPMPESIIKRIEAIAEKEKQEKNLVFSNTNEEPLQDDDAINDNVTAGVDNDDDDDDDDDNTSNNNNPPGILLGELVGNEDEASEGEKQITIAQECLPRAQECSQKNQQATRAQECLPRAPISQKCKTMKAQECLATRIA
jgi:hypothetical protein